MHGISRGRDLRIRWTENTYSALMSRWNFEEEKITMKMSLLLSDSLPVKFLQQMLLSYNFWPNVVAIMASRSLMLSVAKVAFCRKSACKTGNFLHVSDVLHFVVGMQPCLKMQKVRDLWWLFTLPPSSGRWKLWQDKFKRFDCVGTIRDWCGHVDFPECCQIDDLPWYKNPRNIPQIETFLLTTDSARPSPPTTAQVCVPSFTTTQTFL